MESRMKGRIKRMLVSTEVDFNKNNIKIMKNRVDKARRGVKCYKHRKRMSPAFTFKIL